MATDVESHAPADQAEATRWKHTRNRRAIQEGTWRPLLKEHLQVHLAPTRVQNLGHVVITVNLQQSVASQLAVLYDKEPTVTLDSAAATDDEADAAREMFTEARTWTMLGRNNESTIALREGLVRIGWSASAKLPTLRIVTPDVVHVKHTPGDVSDITGIMEWRARSWTNHEKKRVTSGFYDVWDISDPAAPVFKITNAGGEDWSDKFPESMPADGKYPYRWPASDGFPEGKPFLPWVLYHAEDSGRTWDFRKWTEIYEGTLDAGVLWSLFFHCARDASWLQKYTIDLLLGGTTTVKIGGEVSQSVETSPSTVLQFSTKGDKAGSAGTFAAPMKPAEFAAAVIDYTQTIVSHIGIHPADLERSTTAQSGYSIQLKRSAQRRLGLKFEPQFRRGDLELMPKMAQVSNLHAGTSHPIEGYGITYKPADDSIDERQAELDYHLALVAADQMSKVELYRSRHPGTSDEEAMFALVSIEAINRGISATADVEVDEARAEIEEQIAAAKVEAGVNESSE